MKTPEKIYLQACGDCKDNDCENCKFENLEEITWCRDRVFEKDFEYTLTDAFIEKACEWLKECAEHYYGVEGEYSDKVDLIFCKEELLEDFKNYMKGE